MGKKYHENNVRANKKGEKERKDKRKEKISDKLTEQEQCFIKLWETWKKMQAIGDTISGVPRGDAQDARASPLPPLCIPPLAMCIPPPSLKGWL
jgi:hypothetical protein